MHKGSDSLLVINPYKAVTTHPLSTQSLAGKESLLRIYMKTIKTARFKKKTTTVMTITAAAEQLTR